MGLISIFMINVRLRFDTAIYQFNSTQIEIYQIVFFIKLSASNL